MEWRIRRYHCKALKRKKRLESQLTQIDGTLTTLESKGYHLEMQIQMWSTWVRVY